MDFKFSNYAVEEMQRRKIPISIVEAVLQDLSMKIKCDQSGSPICHYFIPNCWRISSHFWLRDGLSWLKSRLDNSIPALDFADS